jgi:uncharacterized protein (UPF0332 family)
MGLSDEERNAIVAIRLQQAKETYSEVKIQIDNGLWRTAVNRLYYACFYATTALMIKYGHQTYTHSGLKGLFGLHFVKTGIISDDIAFVLSALFDMRQKSDYDVWVDIKPKMVLPLLAPAQKFIETIENLIYRNSNESPNS